MTYVCDRTHDLIRSLPRLNFPFNETAIPKNGIYVLFQVDEFGHGADRIVRVGTHTGNDQLRSRLKQHFINENKDRSIFRKNIGRAILTQRNDPFIKFWELDLTTRAAKEKHSSSIDFEHQKEIEHEVSKYIQKNFSFSVFAVEEKNERLEIESKLISTVSLCDECRPSDNWIGNYSPKRKIVESGLWLVNELYKTPFDALGVERLSRLLKGVHNVVDKNASSQELNIQEKNVKDPELLKRFIRVEKTGQSVQISVCKIKWDSPSTSISKWAVGKNLAGGASEAEIQHATTGILKDPKYFRICVECGERKPFGWMHDDNICQGCAATNHGVVY